ncbi:MAG: bifunctional demethylmenaquinone methyltransferase/2-methoxy-6-polyprenyl-1,4-benzoquinol methylase UbiE [Hyphomicrobiales bacterium]|nr:MAG: bifunctional demethylmenaquinone methyltransferase/2-methoxy-6-polyprenyl-1,4-benzoquinol methylase UbiE [Hyphomicrobiales bacterium]
MNQSRERSSGADDMAKSFGFRDVDQGSKQPLVNEVFHQVASRYDLMNDLMSAGMHRIWKSAFISWLAPAKSGVRPLDVLDVAGGTADIAMKIAERSQGHARATVFDINGSMLGVGRERAQKRNLADQLTFCQGNAEDLPFQDKSFDVYTIAFGIRNVPRIDRALQEAYRVLRPGGRFMCLEFSNVDVPMLDTIYDRISFDIIPPLGGMVTGDAESYRYLVESIRKFPNQPRFKTMIETAGFERVSFRNLSGGISAMHSGWKI